MSIAVGALLQHALGGPEPPHEAVERLVSGGPHMGMDPEQEGRERAVRLGQGSRDCDGGRFVDRGWGKTARDLGSALERFSARPSW